MKGALKMECLSLCRGSVGRAPVPGNLEVMLRKAPDTGISLHRSLFKSEGKGVCIPGTLNDE